MAEKKVTTMKFTMKAGQQYGLVKKAPKAAPKKAPAFGGDDSDSGGEIDDAGKDMVSRAIAAQAKKNEKILAQQEQEKNLDYAYDEVYDQIEEERNAIEKAKRESAAKKESRFIKDMKQSAVEREKERELTDLRIIQKEAEKTNHLYQDVDQEMPPMVTSAYKKKMEEQHEQRKKDMVQEKIEELTAVERVGFTGFNSYLLNQLTAKEVEENPEEDYQRELETYIFKREQEKKKERRERYLEMKKAARVDLELERREEEEAMEEDEVETVAAGKAAQSEPETTIAPAAVEPPAPAPEDKPEEKDGAEAGDEETSTPAENREKKIERLAKLESERKAMVRERRLERWKHRNNARDLERYKDRFMKRKLERLKGRK